MDTNQQPPGQSPQQSMQQPAQPYHDPYYQPYPQQPYQEQPQQMWAPVISIKDWLIILLVMIVPVVNIIMMFVWAFSEGNPSKQNYFKASLIMLGIVFGVYILIVLLFIFVIGALGGLGL